MLSTIASQLLYPKAIVLLLTALLVFGWAGFFCTSLTKRYGSKSIKPYVFYITYTLGLSVWIMSNAYFHTGFLVEFGEQAAVAMAIVANLSALVAFASAYQFTVTIKSHYAHAKPHLIQNSIVLITIASCLIWNLIPGYTVRGAIISGPSQFILDFGEYTQPFFLGLTTLVFFTFINLFSIRSSASRIRRTRINYMIMGMTIFMCSTAVIQLGFTYFFQDFSLTWLPPALSVSEMLFMGYAILASRFYSFRYMLSLSLTAAITAGVYTLCLYTLNQYVAMSFSTILLFTIFIGSTWSISYCKIKLMTNRLFYGSFLSPIDKIVRLETLFQESPKKAIARLASYLGVPSDKLRLLDDYQGANQYRSYFEVHSSPLVIDELEDTVEQSSEAGLYELLRNMNNSDSALVLPLYESKNKLSHVLVSSHKVANVNFSYEELKAISRVLKKAQVHINHEQKLRQAQALANSIAHEMRNPLAQVQYEFECLRQKLQEPATPNSLMPHVEQGQLAINRGRQLIDIILREVNSSSLDQEPVEPVSIKSAIENAVAQYGFENTAEANKVNLQLNHDFVAKINETLFNFVIFNILRNAVYYFDSFPNSKIDIRTEYNDYENQIVIRDTGPGIPDDLINRIFDDFFSHNKSGGSGLGLGYCQRVMKSFGGSIRCQSQLDSYTEFTLVFPVSNITAQPQPSELAKHKAAEKKDELYALTQPKKALDSSNLILVVDDKEVQRALVKLYLQQLGYDVVLANNGKVAIEIIQNNPIDLVFMDIQMPIMDGFEAASIIKQSYPTIPIIALSGESGEQDIIRMSELMDGRLSKPTTKTALQRVLQSSLSAKETA
ncbi:hybrid sensor histidine kinase/response regulator [Vibrio atypicus]|uniref:hybrid sensor histidine kinase/response regulator n=1 Tax=Vibrio atypicus TaxID=558271 RepID=UPI003734D45F